MAAIQDQMIGDYSGVFIDQLQRYFLMSERCHLFLALVDEGLPEELIKDELGKTLGFLAASVLVVEYEVKYDADKDMGQVKAKRVAASHVITQNPLHKELNYHHHLFGTIETYFCTKSRNI